VAVWLRGCVAVWLCGCLPWQVFLSQSVSVPAPAQRLATFIRVPTTAGQSVKVTLPPVPPLLRAVIHDSGDVYTVAGKRWNEAGNLQFRVSLGEHNGAAQGGLPFTVVQAASQNVDTC
jgi:hypothetical protein